MVRKCFLLVKVQLLGMFGINKIIHAGSKKEKLQMMLMGLVMLLVAGVMIAYSIGIAVGAKALGMIDVLPPLMLMVSALITLVFTFIKSNGLIFGIRDYDMIMSMPVNSSTVIISRLITVYFMNFLASAIFMVPSIIVYAESLSVSLSIWIMLILSVFIAPLLPMIIAMALGAVITGISMRFKNRSLLTIVLSVIAILGFMVGSYSMNGTSEADIIAIGNSIGDMVNTKYPPAYLFNNAITIGNPWSFILLLLISVGGMFLFVALLSVFYAKINAAMFSHKSSGNYEVSKLKTSTPFKALYIKDLRRLFSSSIYMLNTSICVILGVFASIALLFMNPFGFEGQIGADMFSSIIKLAPLMISVVVTMSSTTAVGMSIEGKNRWIMYSSPISSKTIFDAKIAANLTILIPCVIISSIALSISLKLNAIETLLMFLVPIVYSIFTGVVGLICNLKFPKYDWTSEYQAVKQSISTLVSMVIGVASTLIPIGIGFVLSDYSTIVLLVTTLIIALITLILYGKLKKVKLYL